MNISLLMVGATDDPLLSQLIESYVKRLNHYIKFDLQTLTALKNTKNLSPEQQSQKEGEMILGALESSDRVILLDEKGKQMSSVGFSQFMQKQLNAGGKKLVFIIGGPYGFSSEVRKRAMSSVSLSAMTFSHQMVRLFMVEQCYRAFTILKGEPYHHE
ncbi:MAG TPA: 23S rRNA (pseudouridine(1915)-N(3))-methyltransferase RlmH [Flavobacteriaceae bacterium]|mgnify:FL=1|nr:23S rRNA (pseudouridine(1915)-N(3))-methyltransferase RlmH [Flavobacteriaceae bacterium]